MWKIDATEIDELANRIAQTGERAEKIINDVLHNYAGQEIIDHITPLIPESGRTWKGKKKPAKVSQPFREEQGNLYVVVKTKTSYNYLYFPDDGENTYRHNGDQEFMRRGAEAATENIIDQCVSALVEEIGG